MDCEVCEAIGQLTWLPINFSITSIPVKFSGYSTHFIIFHSLGGSIFSLNFRSIFFFRIVYTFTLRAHSRHIQKNSPDTRKITVEQLFSLVFAPQFTYKSTSMHASMVLKLIFVLLQAFRKHQKPFNQFVCLWLVKISSKSVSLLFSSEYILLFSLK